MIARINAQIILPAPSAQEPQIFRNGVPQIFRNHQPPQLTVRALAKSTFVSQRAGQPRRWGAVQARVAAVHENFAGKGDGAPGRRVRHPFTGILYCGKCGHRMTDAGGGTSRYYKCSAFKDGGVCGNAVPVREDELVEVAIDELKRMFTETSLYDEMMEMIRERLAVFRVKADSQRADLERDLARAEVEITRLVAFISSTDAGMTPGAFDAVRSSLEKASVTRDSIKARLASLQEVEAQPRLPTVEDIVRFVLDIEARIQEDPTSAREALAPSTTESWSCTPSPTEATWRSR